MIRIGDIDKRIAVFIFQGSISSLVVMVLAAKDGEDVLELCATDSGKTPHIGRYLCDVYTNINNSLEKNWQLCMWYLT